MAIEAISEQEHHLWWKEAGGWQLRQILYWRWDPIGVSESFPHTINEYDGYAGAVCMLLREEGGAGAVAEHLARAQTERMDLPPGEDEQLRLERTAALIVRWYPASIGWSLSHRKRTKG